MPPPVRSRYAVIAAGAALLASAFYFAVAANLPHVFLIALFGTLIAALTPRSAPLNHRTLIYGALVAAILAILLNLVFPMDNARFSFLRYVFRSNITAPALVYSGVVCLLFPPSAFTLGTCLGLSLVVNMLTGDALPQGPPEGLSFFGSLMATRRGINAFFYAVAAIEALCFLLVARSPAIRAFPTRPGERKTRNGLRIAMVFLSVFIAAVLGYGSREFYLKYEKSFLKAEKYLTRLLYGVRRRPPSLSGSDVDLNRPLNPEDLKNADAIVLRAAAPTPPGYLRGQAYVSYANGRWFENEASGEKLKMAPRGAILTYSTFSREGADAATDTGRVSVYPTGDFRSDILFVPGTFQQIEIVADRLKASVDGALQPNDWERDGGYFVSLRDTHPDGAYSLPAAPPPNYLAVPEALRGPLDCYLEKIGLSPRSGAPPEVLARKVAEHLSRDLVYALDFAPEQGTDPVIYFLEKRRRGHCELFASAAALLTRRLGVPSRYVTGLVCQENHPSGRYYLSRLKDKHAWVECFDARQRRWVLLEPTPPAGLPNATAPSWSFASLWIDRLKAFFQKVLADMRRGDFAEAVLALIGGFFSALFYLVWNPIGGPLIVLVAIVAATFFFRRRQTRFQRKIVYPLSPTALALNAALQRVETRVRRQHKMSRGEPETLAEFAGRLQELDGPAATFLDAYQATRYSPRRLTPDAARELAERARRASRR